MSNSFLNPEYAVVKTHVLDFIDFVNEILKLSNICHGLKDYYTLSNLIFSIKYRVFLLLQYSAIDIKS